MCSAEKILCYLDHPEQPRHWSLRESVKNVPKPKNKLIFTIFSTNSQLQKKSLVRYQLPSSNKINCADKPKITCLIPNLHFWMRCSKPAPQFSTPFWKYWMKDSSKMEPTNFRFHCFWLSEPVMKNPLLIWQLSITDSWSDIGQILWTSKKEEAIFQVYAITKFNAIMTKLWLTLRSTGILVHFFTTWVKIVLSLSIKLLTCKHFSMIWSKIWELTRKCHLKSQTEEFSRLSRYWKLWHLLITEKELIFQTSRFWSISL